MRSAKINRVRHAVLDNVSVIQDVERRAACVFSSTDLPAHLRAGLSCETLIDGIKNSNLWVSVNDKDEPVGFALAGEFGADFHLEEVSVEPESARQGLGKMLVDTVVQAAVDRGYARVTLTTFSHLAWNLPFYASCGFQTITHMEFEENLRSKLRQEQELGLDNRVAMVLIL